MKSRKIKIALAASALSVTSLLGVATATSAFAVDSPTTKSAPSAEQIAQHQSERKAELATKLEAGVKAGTITQAQADAISAFFEANAPTSPPNKDATEAERQAERDARKAALDTFATENNIPTSFLETLRPEKGGPGHEGKEGTPPSAEDMKAHLSGRLDTAVTEGTITQDQKNLVINYLETNRPSDDAIQNMTEDERHADMEAHKVAFEEFAAANSIPSDLLTPQGPAMGGK